MDWQWIFFNNRDKLSIGKKNCLGRKKKEQLHVGSGNSHAF